MTQLEIRLLDSFYLQDGSAAVTGLSDRQQALLAYLLLNSDQPQPRQQVAFRFWPESSDKQAMTNLRRLLFHLRKSWKAVTKYLAITPQALQWNLGAACHLDVHEFETLIRQARNAPAIAESIHLLEKAVKCYTGDLLPNCYDDWAGPLRDQLRRQYVYGMETLIRSCEAIGNYQAAIGWAERYVRSAGTAHVRSCLGLAAQ